MGTSRMVGASTKVNQNTGVLPEDAQVLRQLLLVLHRFPADDLYKVPNKAKPKMMDNIAKMVMITIV